MFSCTKRVSTFVCLLSKIKNREMDVTRKILLLLFLVTDGERSLYQSKMSEDRREALSANGYFFEVHPTPDTAKSDGANMLYLSDLEGVIKSLL